MPAIDPERADAIPSLAALVRQADKAATPPEYKVPGAAAATIVDRVRDLETEVMQQNAHILVLHRIVDQVVDQVQGLRHQLGLSDWTPQVRAEDNP
jgi:hypothetical protein